MSNRVIYNVEWNLPRVNLSMPGRQNRSGNGLMKITPGMTEVFEFNLGNVDGVPLNLQPFQVKFVIWLNRRLDLHVLSVGESEVVLSKLISISDPYSGKCLLVLTEEDTMALILDGARSYRWSVFMINTERQVFPLQVTNSGDRSGTIQLDIESGLPVSEQIRGA